MSTPPLIITPREPLRSGLPVSVLRRLVCSTCQRKVRVVQVSGTVTTVACRRCGRQWLVSPEGQAVQV